ncbi:iron-containing alcohol dehydrogenase [Sediminicurvatus halobius]|uniref:Alcohol dehydrogenase n=1 Tax=Sediminicurvatus halobius TaxID=2182432 RepID=A0A2U2MXI0_9GAMM|nr:iron-containing alcohol dehydrogenase [Spiribacter halobius]PWG61526.1 alcohol dehydrogenase [Spiribacter halobius]UEX78005.1 iron-containing alcohol dehydrogenase [Spiribacter halobius]
MNYHRPFSYELPTRLEFGIGLTARLGDFAGSLGGSKALVITDPGLIAAGVVDRVTTALDRGAIGYTVFSDVESEPDARGVEASVERYRAEGCDVIVAVGGGSALDTGKAVSAMLTNPGHIRDYAGLGVVKEKGAPFIAIPTTAGTGSEATIWAVISEKDKGRKYGVGSPLTVPDIALCDPELTVTLPPRVTAVTGIDALAHALESYVNKATQPISEALSERAIALVGRSLRTAVFAGDTLTARADMLLASSMAAMAFNPTRLGLAHALAMPLGANAKIPHADVIAILLPPVMRFNVVANLEKFAHIAELFGERVSHLPLRDAAEAGVRSVERLIRDVGAPNSLAAYGVREADLEGMAEGGLQSGNVPVNPRATTREDLVAIMRECL